MGTTKEKMSHKSLFCRKDNARASRKWSAPLVGGILADLAVVKDHFFDRSHNQIGHNMKFTCKSWTDSFYLRYRNDVQFGVIPFSNKERNMDIVFHGKPGSGKGTQSDNICEQLNIVAVSTGDLIRAEIKGNTEMGQQIKAYSQAGKLVPDELVMDILGKRLEQEDVANGVLFDGFPRTANQATMLKDWLAKRGRQVDGVFALEITDEESMSEDSDLEEDDGDIDYSNASRGSSKQSARYCACRSS